MRGVTLLELMLVTALLAIAAGVVSLGWRGSRPGLVEVAVREFAAAHARAVRAGRPVRSVRGQTEVWFWPDGSATPARIQVDLVSIMIDPLTGIAHVQR